MTRIEELQAQAAAIKTEVRNLRAATAPKRVMTKLSTFRGWGIPMALPTIGSKIVKDDYCDGIHECTIIDHDGDYWSDSTIGREGRWCTIEVPPSYVTKHEMSLRMQLNEIEDQISSIRYAGKSARQIAAMEG